MPGSRTTLPHTALTLLLTAPLSCAHDQEGQVSDPQGCRTVILPADATPSTSSGTDQTGTSSTSSTSTSNLTTDGTSADASTSSTGSTSTGSTTATMPECGDRVVDDGEECDDGDGNNGPGKACNAECMRNVCGDMDESPEEECDDGNADNTDGCVENCVTASCGDGFVQAGVEECDDGNGEDFDGCSAACAIERIIFVSSGVYKGDSNGVQGLAGADAICQTLAASYGLTANGQTFMAWLSAGRDSPANRFPEAVTSAKGPFLLPDFARTKIAENWTDLIDGNLAQSIKVHESGLSVPESTVWTNTKADGTPADKGDCSGWTSSANMAKGGIGFTTADDSDWTDSGDNYCANSARIYCFQVTP